MEHEEKADRLERELDDLEERSERVEDRIEETREDWESKEKDSTIPGAQPDEGEEDGS
jgi:predicted  nucleic acid-binding Zn-ribbon protein